jgi:hypothetical protein
MTETLFGAGKYGKHGAGSAEISADGTYRYRLTREWAIVMGDASVVTEHAQLMSGGGYHVWNTEPCIEEIYPLAQKIKAAQRFGGKVYRRRVIVVEDWTEVPPA